MFVSLKCQGWESGLRQDLVTDFLGLPREALWTGFPHLESEEMGRGNVGPVQRYHPPWPGRVVSNHDAFFPQSLLE